MVSKLCMAERIQEQNISVENLMNGVQTIELKQWQNCTLDSKMCYKNSHNLVFSMSAKLRASGTATAITLPLFSEIFNPGLRTT